MSRHSRECGDVGASRDPLNEKSPFVVPDMRSGSTMHIGRRSAGHLWLGRVIAIVDRQATLRYRSLCMARDRTRASQEGSFQPRFHEGWPNHQDKAKVLTFEGLISFHACSVQVARRQVWRNFSGIMHKPPTIWLTKSCALPFNKLPLQKRS